MRQSLLRIREMLLKELRQIFRDPKTRRIIFISPVLQLLLFGYAVNTDVHNTALFVVDHDHTEESRALVDAMTAGGYFRLAGASDRPQDMAAALDGSHAVVGLEIPVDFARDLAAGRGAVAQVLIDGTSSNTATVAQGYATQIVQRFGLDYAANHGQLPAGGVDLRVRAWFNPALESRVYNIPAVIGVILMLMSLLLTALTVVRERELGTLDQLMVSPLSPTELILGKTLPVAGIAFVDLALVTAVGMLWFHVPLRGSIALLLVASTVYILAALGFGLLISTISNTQQEAFMAMFLFFLPMIILSGFMYPVESMPRFFQELTLLNPVRHFLEIVRGVFLKGEGFADLWPQLLALVAMAAAVLTIATTQFRKTLD
jgi:drug efflux transport system permease protein